ncbi:MAG: DUF4956 domain-containing protein [Eubacteriales bacterium]|nr:DUF4956 domain-containing protein [Eubacteriales bacterium]
MKETLYNLLAKQGDMTWQQIILNVGVSALIGVVIYISYMLSHKGTIYSKKFGVTLVALTVMTGTVMTVIGNNIALSLGMVGALSIVRFRTALKDSRDTVYVFWTIIVGICCGVGDYVVAATGSTAVFLVFLLFGAVRSDTRMLLVIRADRSIGDNIEALVFQYFSRSAVLRVKNTNGSRVEYIYEMSRRTLEKAQSEHSSLTDDFYRLGSVESVNIVAQSDEIYN